MHLVHEASIQVLSFYSKQCSLPSGKTMDNVKIQRKVKQLCILTMKMSLDNV